MEEKPAPVPEPDEIVVKKSVDEIADKDLNELSGGKARKTQLSGPFDDYSGGSYTCAGDL
ncbi:MAG TPA: hypothetical protein PLH72_08725 [Vicinamibacterales bacterium]|mgnify:CR=1 FL=1|nr:hypothetical protein [Vicinamibacterales bacterium]